MKRIYLFLLMSMSLFSTAIDGQTTYNDVASIFYRRCTSCHHAGGIAPMPLMDYSDANAYSSSIGDYVSKDLMPPWPPDTTYTRFLHERIITSPEKNAIIQWVLDGALEGNPALAPTPPLYGPMKYELCPEPTMTLRIPTFHSNASPSNTNPYDCFAISTNLTQDRWLRAYEVIPGDRTIVHHVVVTVDTTGNANSDLSGNCTAQGGQFGIGGWSSGAAPVVFPGKAPLKAGIRIKAGSKLILQIHYAPGSDGKVDSTGIRLYFYPVGETGIRPAYSNTWLQNWFMSINANDSITYSATHAVGNSSISLFSTSPHSHNICTRITNYADKSGSPTIPIVRINAWNYHWQGDYYFPKLLKIPNGYTIRGNHFYNNTPSNPNHPNPSNLVSVSAGTKTSDEMLFDSFIWLKYQTGDENIDIAALLACDTLLVCKPVKAGLISGTSTICAGQSGVSYSVPIIDNAATYTWFYSGTGATIHGNDNSVTIDFGPNATAGNLTVVGNNTCGISGPVSANYVISLGAGAGVGTAGTITGASSVCKGQSGVTYTVPSINNATSYSWSYSGTGHTIHGTGNQVTIDFDGNATSGNLTVMGTSGCGNGAVSSTYAITVNNMPSTPTIGVTNSCGSSTLTSSVTSGTYLWSPGGQTTQAITVTTGGTYSVTVSTGGSCSATSAGSAITITPGASVTGTDASRCGAGVVTLGATPSSGTVNWYDALTNGTLLTTGTSYTTPNISNTTTYYVDVTDNGCTSSPRVAVTATVNNGATATISGTTKVCSGSSGVLSIALTGTPPWAFTYGSSAGSNAVTNINNSTYTVAATAGTYTVGAVSDGSTCTGTGSGSATITENSAIVLSTPVTNCINGNTAYTVDFDMSGGDVASYSVSGAGNKTTNTHFTSSPINTGTAFSFSVTDTYNCSPVATVNGGSPNCGCSATANISTTNGSICPGTVATITVTLGGTGPWNFTYAIGGVSQTPITSVNSSPYTFTTSTTGAYTLVSVTDANCTNTGVTGTATVSQSTPTATISGSGGFCPGGSRNLIFDLTSGTAPWDFIYSDGTNNFGPINSITSQKLVSVQNPGTYTLLSFTVGACSGTPSGSATITVHSLPTIGSTATPSGAVCAGSSVTLNGTGAGVSGSYSWSDGKTNNQSFNITSTATFTVTGTDGNGCTNKAIQTVTVNQLPVINPVSTPTSAAVCAGDDLTLSGNGSLSYTWSGPEAVSDGVAFKPTQSGLYTVSATDINNCTGTAIKGISVLQLPNVGIAVTPSVTICGGESVTLNGTGASTYSWSDGISDGGSFKPSKTATFTVTGTLNSCSATATQQITVIKCVAASSVGIKETSSSLQQISVYPNPTNGLFNIAVKNASFKELSISVVDMLGTEVFTAADKNNSTDYNLEINLESLSKGMYYLRISAGSDSIIKKLILQ